MDSWFASEFLKNKIHELGFHKIIIAGKSNYTFTIGKEKKKALEWKKSVPYTDDNWGINVPFVRVVGKNPTFGNVVLFFFKKNSTNNYYLLDFCIKPIRGAEAWHIWGQHYIIEHFWKLLKSVLHK